MAIIEYSGRLSVIGAGTWSSDDGHISSVIEIGNHTLRNIKYSDYLATYLTPGLPMTLSVREAFREAHPVLNTLLMLIAIGLVFTIIGAIFSLFIYVVLRALNQPTITAITIDNKIYKD